MSSNYTTNLKNKRVISITGDESEVFLNNIITNDIKKIETKKAIYSCLLSPQGKVISHFFITKIEDQFLFIIDSFLINELIEKLNFYKLQTKINIKEETKYCILFTLDDKHKINPILEFDDPRNKKLGKYLILNQHIDKNIKLDNEDSIIFSSKKIPGNERKISKVENMFLEKNVNIFNEDNDQSIHVSGHPCKDEIMDMYTQCSSQKQ